MEFESLYIREVMVFLVAAGVVIPLFRRLKVSPVLGFLIVGLAIGPFGLGRLADTVPWLGYLVISDLEGVRAFAELGIMFLLFMIGLELSIDRLWAMRRLVFGLGGVQVVVTGAVIALIASAFGNAPAVAVILGAGLALSSTAIVMQLLAENRRLGTAAGQTSFSILLFQDLAVLPILFLVGAFGAQGEGSVVLAFAWAIGEAIIAVVIILVLGRLVIRPLFRFIGSDASRETFLAFVLLVIIGTALATSEAGLSLALGAFLAGLLLAETEYRHEIEIDIEPFRGLLLGLFFASVGMGIDITRIGQEPFLLIASAVGLFLVKSPIIYALARLFGQSRSVALESGLLLGQGGEFGFLVVSLALGLGLMPGDTAQFMLIVTGLTMLATPTMAQAARALASRVEAWEAARGQRDIDVASDLSGHVIVAGYGRVGQMIGSILDDQELTHIGLDTDARLVAGFRKEGGCVFYGDASRAEMLRKFGADKAAALVVTMDSPRAAEEVASSARRNWPELTIYARARDAAHASRLIGKGANHVIPETMEASLQLGEMVLTGAGVPEPTARRIIDIRRAGEQAAVDKDGG